MADNLLLAKLLGRKLTLLGDCTRLEPEIENDIFLYSMSLSFEVITVTNFVQERF